MKLWFLNIFLGKRQEKCFGGDKELYHPLIGQCGVPDQQPGYKLSQTLRSTTESTSRNGIKC